MLVYYFGTIAKKSSLQQRTILKKRKSLGVKNLLDNSKFNFIFFMKSSNVELRYLSILKKLLKKVRHGVSKTVRRRSTRLFLSLSKNYSYTKKSKNSRMGKGKGKITRYLIRVPKFKPFIYFNGHYGTSISKVATYFSSRTRVIIKVSNLNNDRSLFGLGKKNHPYSTYKSTKLQ